MTNAIDGLVSGLNTTALIDSQIQFDAIPQTLLKNKVSDSQTLIAALQGLNTSVANLATLATATAQPSALDLYAVSSSSTAVSATATAGASPGALDVVVNALAQSQSGVSAPLTAWPANPAVLTIVGSTGTSIEITAASTSLDDVATAVNAAGAGVTATKVASGIDPVTGAQQYRIQFTGNATGAAGAFTVYQGSSADVAAGTATNVLTAAGAAVIRTAQDAQVTLWSGTAAQQAITSSTNSFANLLPGVAVTVSAVSASPVTVTVARNDAQISKMAGDLVTSLNGIFAQISTKTVVVNSTNAKGAAVMSPGVFTGDSGIRDVNQKILTAASQPVNGHSPSEIGISITKTGTLEYDGAKFAAALAKDPAGVKATLQVIASRVAVAATSASDKYTGQLTVRITSQQSAVKDLSDQISEWDLRLASRRETLQSTYTALETQLSAMKSQSAWLTSQLSGLSTSGTGA
ncbi:MAG TPA: flagellar filament capping protein FliD [Cryobacterium sp.]|nr:flagellar filament capping protein FliD [Cryobacterium sp.]